MALETILLDVHAHLVPLKRDDAAHFPDLAWDDDKGVAIVDGHMVGFKLLYQPDALIAWMDQNAVRRALISAPPPLYRQHLREQDAQAWSAHLTAGLDSIATKYPAQFSVLAHLPLHAPAAAAALAQDRISQGFNLFSAPSGGAGELTLSDPAFDPLWLALDAAHAFLFMHPGECADGRLSDFYLSNLLGNPYESTVALAHLVFGGIIERFPNIRFCFAHGGGAAAALAGRFQQGFATKRPGISTNGPEPRQLLRRICVDCITHDDAALGLSAQVFGSENVVFGSDWPFPMGLLDPHRQLSTASPDRRRAIFCDNPAALMGEQTKSERTAKETS